MCGVETLAAGSLHVQLGSFGGWLWLGVDVGMGLGFLALFHG